MSVMNGFDTESGERVFVYGADNSGFFEDAQATSAWKRYAEEFGPTPENQARLGEILTQLHGHTEHMPLSQFVDALSAGMDAGEFTRAVEEEPQVQAQVDVPRDRNGRPLTEAQQKWSEYRHFAETHSSRECRERTRSDSGFATFVRKNLEREMSGVGDAVENLNARPESPKAATPDLVAWVSEYRQTPAEKIRQLMRADFNPDGYELYNKNFNAAVAAGLI